MSERTSLATPERVGRRADDANRDGVLAGGVVGAVRFGAAVRRGVRETVVLVGSTVTALGWCVVGAIAVGMLFGYLLGWPELIAIAWACLILLLVAVLFLIGRNSFRIRLSLPLTRVVVGDRAPAEVIVENPSRRHIAGVGVEVPVGEGLAEFHIPGLARGSEASEVFLVPAEHRGVIHIGPVRTSRGDPVGLLRRELTWAERTELYVHPRTVAIPSVSTGYVRDLEGVPTRDLTASDVSFHALREYMPGDDRRFIHWRSSARTGTYMVRQFEETRRSHIMVVLATADADCVNDEEFELAVSAAGSLGVSAIRDARSVSVSVATPGRRSTSHALSTASRVRLLDDLTLLDQGADRASLVEVTRMAGRTGAGAVGASVVFLVTGSGTSVAELRQAAASLPPGVEVVAVVCDPGVVPTMRRVAELTVVTIGFLDDLQKSLARAAAV